MIIKDVRLARTGGATVLSARCKIRKIGWDTVYFSVSDPAHGPYVCNDASPFAAALLLPSMREGEDLIIKGNIPEQLYKGMYAVMQEALHWHVGLKPIRIHADELTADAQQPDRIASFFSGGVDSFYSYLKHKADPAGAGSVDSLLLVNGFDIDLHSAQLWNRTLQHMQAVAAAENVELVVVQTNIREFVAPILSWDYSHGGCLAAIGLLLRNEFRQIYIPSTHSVDEQIAWGSNLALDEHWSTEGVTFVHDGTEATRLEKVISQIAQSPLALEHLRVCYEDEDGAYNCAKCDKCLRTMINLYIAGALDRAGTFPHHIDPELVAAVPTIADENGSIFHNENLRALREAGLAPDLQRAIAASLDSTAARKTGLSAVIKERMIYLDHMYSGGYAYSAWHRLFGGRPS
jgi:hypothetical protein